VAHELVHRSGKFERALAEVLMMQVSYTHFCIEHVLGHHANVATPRDPATARAGESFYAFLPRTVFGGVASAWCIEAVRMKRGGRPVFSLGNRMLRYAAELILLYGVAALLFGAGGVLFLAAQSIVAFTMLEVVNYLEHYGLQRREVRPGRFEPTRPYHSWNSSHRVTNWFLFNLGRHSDHHAAAGRRFHTLRHFEEAPQLPIGYAAIFVLALVPPLWRRVMDPRLADWRARYLPQSSLSPGS
jgi:alkane 1-monooxygenase